MCRPTTCEVCGKTTWKGCGKHIDSVKEQVPPEQWCDKNHTDEEYANAEKSGLNKYESICSQGTVKILESLSIFAFRDCLDTVLSEKVARHGS